MITRPRLDPIRLDIPLLDSAGRPTQQFARWIFDVVRTAQAVSDLDVLQAFDPEAARPSEAQTSEEPNRRDPEPETLQQIELGQETQPSAALWAAVEDLRAQVETAAAIARSSAAKVDELLVLVATAAGIEIPRALTVESLAPFVDSATAVQIRKAADGSAVVNVDTSNGRVGVNKPDPAEPVDVIGNVQASLAYKVAGNQVVGPRKTAVSISTQATTQTAGASYTANEQTMLANLKTDVGNIITALTALRDRLKVTGGHGLIAD